MNREKLQEIFDTGLYCITGEEFSRGRSTLQVVRELIAAGVKIIQYREKGKKPLYKYQECLQIRQWTQEAGVLFIVNDDLDIARLVGADGVHVGQEDLPLEKVRELVGPEMIVGLSTHCPEQAREALAKGADYIGVGPIFATATKKDALEPVGLEYLDYVVQEIPLPFVAIGGIKGENIQEVKRRGARCVALISEILGAPDIGAKVRELKKLLEAVP